MKQKLLILASFFTFIACIGKRQYTPIQYYDFGKPELQKLQLNIDSFSTEGPYKERFITRQSGNSLIKNEYHRWAQAPDLLLNHYFKQSFNPGSLYYLSGEVLTIEHDLTENKAVLKVLYNISKEGRSVQQSIFQSILETNGSTESFVNQISQAVSELNSEISRSLTNLQ